MDRFQVSAFLDARVRTGWKAVRQLRWKLVSPARRRQCIEHVMKKHGVKERLACRVLGQHRSTQRKVPKGRADDAALTADIVELATQYGRYGYRRITALLREAGWLARERETGGAHLAAGRSEGAS
jgi:hypothetical protein